MKSNFDTLAAVALCCWTATVGAALGQGTAFTYQGRLIDNGALATGTYDLRSTIYDDSAAGNAVSVSITNIAIPVANGLFTVTLDFGNVFDGSARWLDIGVRTNGGAAFTTLNPRQPLTAAPYAVTAGDLAGAPVARLTTPNTASTATGTPVIANGSIVAANVTSGGSGYTTPPVVTVSDTTGSGAFITAALFKGAVASLTVQNPGQNYSSKTVLTIGPPPSNGYQNFMGTNYFTGLNTFANANNEFAGTFSGDGAGLGNLNASGLSSGIIADARLSSNVALLNTTQTFTGADRFSGPATMTNVNNVFAGRFSGDGTGLTNLPAPFAWQTATGTSQQAEPNTGYIAANSAQVVITLPPAPAVGATIRVAGAGAGGWRISQNTAQTILAGNSAFAGASIAEDWIPRSISTNWVSVASSADGTKLAGVAYGGQIYTSGDSGLTWTPRSISTNWHSVASSADGVKLVAVNYGGQIYTSEDSGVSWTPHETNRFWSSVASSTDGTKLVAVGYVGQIYTSSDSGLSWTPRAFSADWQSVASSADGTKLVTAVVSGQIYTSSDSGASWTPRESNRSWSSVASSADGTKLVACVNGGLIYTSVDSGVNWTPRGANGTWEGVASSADGTKLVVVAFSPGLISASSDSAGTWFVRNIITASRSVACSADGTKLVLAAPQLYTSAAIVIPGGSTSTGSAGFLTGGQGAAIELLYMGNNQFLTVSFVPTILAY